MIVKNLIQVIVYASEGNRFEGDGGNVSPKILSGKIQTLKTYSLISNGVERASKHHWSTGATCTLGEGTKVSRVMPTTNAHFTYIWSDIYRPRID